MLSEGTVTEYNSTEPWSEVPPGRRKICKASLPDSCVLHKDRRNGVEWCTLSQHIWYYGLINYSGASIAILMAFNTVSFHISQCSEPHFELWNWWVKKNHALWDSIMQSIVVSIERIRGEEAAEDCSFSWPRPCETDQLLQGGSNITYNPSQKCSPAMDTKWPSLSTVKSKSVRWLEILIIRVRQGTEQREGLLKDWHIPLNSHLPLLCPMKKGFSSLLPGSWLQNEAE